MSRMLCKQRLGAQHLIHDGDAGTTVVNDFTLLLSQNKKYLNATSKDFHVLSGGTVVLYSRNVERFMKQYTAVNSLYHTINIKAQSVYICW